MSSVSPPYFVLGVESSCDETAAAVVRFDASGQGHILSNVVLSQIDEHAAYGGVVPEIAARAHVEAIDRIIASALSQAQVKPDDLTAVAATSGPGLIGGLLVGTAAAKAIAWRFQKPYLAINHLEAHVLTPRLTDRLPFPYLVLLISGGHTQLLIVKGVDVCEKLGTTMDDALGEAFDKVAKMLSLGHPGGVHVEKMAAQGQPLRFSLPQPMIGREGCDFSFSGIKTAVRQLAEKQAPLSIQDQADICAAFQRTVVASVADRVRRAYAALNTMGLSGLPLVAAGGVAANQALRLALGMIADENQVRFIVPEPHLCTDNAVMVAWAGAEHLALGKVDSLHAPTRARWPLAASSLLSTAG